MLVNSFPFCQAIQGNRIERVSILPNSLDQSERNHELARARTSDNKSAESRYSGEDSANKPSIRKPKGLDLA